MTAREMREKRGKIAHDMAALDLTVTENRAKFDAMDAEQAELKDLIDRSERAERLEAEMRGSGAPPSDGPAADAAAAELNKYNTAFGRYLRVGLGTEFCQRIGESPLNSEERTMITASMQRARQMGYEARDMGVAGGATLSFSGAGPFVPTGFVNKVESALKFFGGMLEAATIMPTTTGQPLPWPTDNDTSISGELVGEGSATNPQDVTISMISFGAYKFSTKYVRVSLEMLQDSAFDIETYLSDKFATRLGRVWNTYFTTGTGSSQPKGIVVAATASSQTVLGDDNLASPDPTSQVGYIDLVNLEHQVDRAYRNGAKWMFHDTTLRYAKTLKDKYGRPLWLPGLGTNSPDTILGYGFIVNNDMAQLGPSGSPLVGSKSVLFGRLDKYMIRRVKDLSILRLDERFAEYGQVAFLGWARADGNLLDAGTHPVKVLQNPAS